MIYFVTFEIHQACRINEMIFHCEAKNATEAKEAAKKFWSSLHGLKGHQFHIYAKRSNIQDVERVNGISQYGPKAGQHYRA